MLRVYISGPVTGEDPEQADREFRTREEKLKAAGFDVMNPQRVCASLPRMRHGEYMRLCFRMMDMCNAVTFLRGWRGSQGACEELGYAIANNIQVLVGSDTGYRMIDAEVAEDGEI